jgi:hypothetical protein
VTLRREVEKMPVNSLVVTVEATHQSLQQRLREATEYSFSPNRPRERFARVDALMAATGRHLAAVDEVLLGVAADKLPHGHERVRAYLHEARLLELAMSGLKARLYGEVHAAHLPWSQVWHEVQRALVRHNDLERALVADLARELSDAASDALAEQVYRAEVRAPTRAHPNIPHRGRLGHLARRLWAVADRFWDTAEGRVIPRPVRPPVDEHAADSLMAQYLMGEPHLDDKAPLFAHRRRHH